MESQGTVGPDWPNALNLASAVANAVALVAALRRWPRETIVATALASGLELVWIEAIARQYDRRGSI